MNTGANCKLTLLCMLISNCAVADEHIPPPSMRSEAIVRFVDGSSISNEINLSVDDDWTPSAGVHAYAQALSEKIAVPFVVTRITSGRDLLLTIQMDKIQAELISHVVQHPDVKNAAPLTDTEPLRNRWSAVRIVFVPGSPSHQAILECGDEESAENSTVTKIAEALVANFTHPTIADAMPPDQLILDLDSTAITLEFVEKLKAIDDVTYAQPNFIFHN